MALASLIVLLASSFAPDAATNSRLAPQATDARRASAPIRLDGRLEEPDWQKAQPLDLFWENYPHNRTAAPERTEARFLYDDHYLYVGFRALLRDPSQLRKPFVRRDKVGSSHDYVQVYLDPQGNGQSSTLFRVNARGTETDGVQDEAGQSESTDPDFEWEVRSAIDDRGWTSELRIPLSTLRVSKSGPQTWNVVVTRGVPRDQNTQMATAPWPSDGSCFLCLASKLSFPDLEPSGERLILEPSFSSLLSHDSGVYGSGTRLKPEPGLDAKWLPYGGAAVDLTINPDFSQVESDSPQLTANQRFALNLPEKRPFFREGADLIGTPLPLLYTRTVTAPDYGLRFTHRSSGLNGTAFLARDSGRGEIIEPGLLASDSAQPDFSSTVLFAHVNRGFGPALAGVLAAAKLNSDGSYNALGGFDAAIQSSTDRLSAQLVESRTRNPDRPDLLEQWRGQKLSGTAAFAQWDHTSSLVSTLRYTRYDRGFRSWLGFVPRVGYADYYAFLQKPLYLPSPAVRRLGPYLSFDLLDPVKFNRGEQDAAIGLTIDGYKALAIDLSWHPRTRVLDEQGAQHNVPQVRWTASIQPSGRLPYISLGGAVGRDVDYATGAVGRLVNLVATIRTRPLDRAEIEARYSYLHLAGGTEARWSLEEKISELLATWYFGPAFYVLADFQRHQSTRRSSLEISSRSSLASLQVVWQPLLNWRAFFGVRSGALRADQSAGRSTEFYLKLTRRLALGG